MSDELGAAVGSRSIHLARRPLTRAPRAATSPNLIKNSHVVGVTTNPSIFAEALANGERYDAQVRESSPRRRPRPAVRMLTTNDVRDACRRAAPVFDDTDDVDGRVSIEVAPGWPTTPTGTVTAARQLWQKVDRPNLFIKIPGTPEGCPAITDTIGRA